MFKSSFSKYLTALTVIILAGFLMLSGIIISIIRAHTTSDKQRKLELASSIIANRIIDFKDDGKYVDKMTTYEEYLRLNR